MTTLNSPPTPQLRICRHWHWVPVPLSGSEMRYGDGPAPVQLEAKDVTEAWVDGQWIPLPLFEMPKPEHPSIAVERALANTRGENMAEMFKQIEHLLPSESHLAKRGRRD